jgi:hypothetical protein
MVTFISLFRIDDKNSIVNELAYKLGLRLLKYSYVRRAVSARADLREFRGKPTARILLGVLAICLSFALCWPVISALGTLCLYLRRPMLVVVLGPIVWGLTHCLFLFGMALSGEKYLRILLRWLTRISVEKLLRTSPQPAQVMADSAS